MSVNCSKRLLYLDFPFRKCESLEIFEEVD